MTFKTRIRSRFDARIASITARRASSSDGSSASTLMVLVMALDLGNSPRCRHGSDSHDQT
jgi:hypothetical protein